MLGAPADVAVMARPRYLRLIGQEEPVLVFANLLENDPINLVVRKELAEERGLSADMPLIERLNAIRGLRVGVAPGPPVRLRVLFESVGLDADSDIEMVIIPGDEQNQAYEEGLVDALYAHTPFLERALVEQGAVMIVNQSAGEVPELGPGLQHALVTTRDYANANPEVLVALAKALHRAQQLVHADLQAAADAIRGSGVKLLAPQGLETIVAIYEPAIPQTPEVSVEAVLKELALFPAHQTPPDLSGIDLTKYVEPRFAQQAISESPPTPSATAAATPTAIATPVPTASPTATATTAPPPQGETIHATIQNFRHPDLTVRVGDTIVWTQRDSTTHTTTSGLPTVPDGIWDSAFLNNSQTFSLTLTEVGTFPYYCTIHPSMRAIVTVVETGSSDTESSPPEATPGSSGDDSGSGDYEY
ncbi:MAG: ABC transporter substrate-binding protein [Chloroflexi bacterium]|nr:ABC transporter substrate-binding protein [Chloroflexota bacterium]